MTCMYADYVRRVYADYVKRRCQKSATSHASTHNHYVKRAIHRMHQHTISTFAREGKLQSSDVSIVDRIRSHQFLDIDALSCQVIAMLFLAKKERYFLCTRRRRNKGTRYKVQDLVVGMAETRAMAAAACCAADLVLPSPTPTIVSAMPRYTVTSILKRGACGGPAALTCLVQPPDACHSVTVSEARRVRWPCSSSLSLSRLLLISLS